MKSSLSSASEKFKLRNVRKSRSLEQQDCLLPSRSFVYFVARSISIFSVKMVYFTAR